MLAICAVSIVSAVVFGTINRQEGVLDTGYAARLIRAVSARRGVMRLGKKIIKTLVFLVILLAVFVLLAFLTPKAM